MCELNSITLDSGSGQTSTTMWYGVICQKIVYTLKFATPIIFHLWYDFIFSQADAEKDKGNVSFKAGKFQEAVMRYTDAIAICPLSARTKQSIYYR